MRSDYNKILNTFENSTFKDKYDKSCITFPEQITDN